MSVQRPRFWQINNNTNQKLKIKNPEGNTYYLSIHFITCNLLVSRIVFSFVLYKYSFNNEKYS